MTFGSKTEGCLHGQAAQNLVSSFMVEMQTVRLPLVQTTRFTHRIHPDSMISETIGCTILTTSHLDPTLKPNVTLLGCLRLDVCALLASFSDHPIASIISIHLPYWTRFCCSAPAIIGPSCSKDTFVFSCWL